MNLQDYQKKPEIPGVQFIPLKIHSDDGGSFTELGRFVNLSGAVGIEGYLDGDPIQINCSRMHPGVVKAFHLHKIQTDIFYTPDKLIINLIDVRPYHQNDLKGVNLNVLPRMRFVLDNTRMVTVPPGVLHGLANPYNKDATLIYFVNQKFNPQDEWRIPWNVVGEDIWEISKE